LSRPNVILLTIDTLRADVLGCYGYERLTTPHLDRLAKHGIRFTQTITGGSWTQAAFPALLTSSSASHYGGALGSLARQRPSPIEALARHGYATAGFSTNPHLSRATGYDRGFDAFFDLEPGERDPWLRRVKGGERLLRSPFTHQLARLLGSRSRPARIYASAAEVTGAVCRWLGSAEQPFFAWAHYMDVHWPYYLEETLADPQTIAGAWQDLGLMHEWGNGRRTGLITDKVHRRFLRLYEESLQYLDEQIGRLLAFLEEDGRAANTLVIVVSDHGEEFFDHGRWGHWEDNLYDEIIRVPLIIRLPGQAAEQVVERQVTTLDVMPTILDLCACPLPSGVEGSSLRPLWEPGGNQSPYPRQEVICEMPRDSWCRIAVRTEQFKLIWDNRCPDEPELYNLRRDPGEQKNVFHEHPQVAHLLQERVEAHLAQAAATLPDAPAGKVTFDDHIVQRLRDLGYLE
jgi:arylsulfatase A-like enzyme